jgi:hypothetical protein
LSVELLAKATWGAGATHDDEGVNKRRNVLQVSSKARDFFLTHCRLSYKDGKKLKTEQVVLYTPQVVVGKGREREHRAKRELRQKRLRAKKGFKP